MRKAAILALAALLAGTVGAKAQSVEEFYRGKTVTIAIGFTPGGGYDLYARLLARHLGKHIPGNPTIRPENMPGAGSLRAAKWLYEAAPRDGTAFGTIVSSAPFDPLFGNPEATFKATEFGYVGSANNEVSVCAFSKRSGARTVDDLRAKSLSVGGTGDTADTVQYPKLLNSVLGAKLKIVKGYPGGNEINLAMERGEVDGRCGWSWSSLRSTKKAEMDSGEIAVVLQLSSSKHADLPNVPLVTDFATKPDEKDLWRVYLGAQVLGRPYIAPPGLPADRLIALRRAFDATMADPEFVSEAERAGLEINPVKGEDVQKVVAEVYATDPAVVKRIQEILGR